MSIIGSDFLYFMCKFDLFSFVLLPNKDKEIMLVAS